MRSRTRLIAATVLATALSQAQAAVVSFTSESSYNASVGSQLFLIDFNGLSGLSNGNFTGQVDFGSPDSSTPDNVAFSSTLPSNGSMTDAGGSPDPLGVGPIGGVFASPVNAFGLVFSSSGNAQTVELYDGSASLIGSLVTPIAGFFGVVSDTPIKSFIIRNGEFANGNNDRFFVDDFRANVAPIPEPSTYALLGLGLGVLLLAARRARKQIA
jgi:hypothetical protein